MSQDNFSQRYKAYTRKAKAEGREPLSFNQWKERYALRAPRGSKKAAQATSTPTAQQIVAKRAEGHVGQQTMQNPDDPATGRQLWFLNSNGLLGEVITKAQASSMIEAHKAAQEPAQPTLDDEIAKLRAEFEAKMASLLA